MTKFIIFCVVLMTCFSFLRAQPPAEQKLPADVQKAKEVVAAHLAKIKGSNGTILHISDESLAKTFPKHTFFAVRYRLFPVAEQRPEGMAASNVFAVSEGKFEHLDGPEMLERFFKNHGPIPAGDAKQRALVSNWLLLSQEFVQDGFYRLEVDPAVQIESLKNGTNRLSGRAVVMAGGNGEIQVRIELDNQDKILRIANSSQVKPGPRPICQATKLLDPDPIVRKMAEQDLLYMGLAARDYMMEQRDQAAPELRAAIDLLWNKILQNGW